MARTAARPHCGALNLILIPQPIPFFGLVVILGRPFHVEHLIPGPDVAFRLAMTLDAPLHIERCDLISERHQINSPVTRRATDALVDVNAVIEINEVGQIVHPRPFDRLTRAPALANGLEIRTVGPNLRVAIHASLCRRNASISELFDGRVTVTAIYSVIAHVMLVTELNGLLAREVSLSVIGGPVEFEKQPDDYCDKENGSEDCDLRDEVRASMKDLAHRLPSSKWS